MRSKERLIREYICACLAKNMGLPILDFAIVDVPEYLVELDSELEFHLGSGPCFASRYKPYLQEFDRASLLPEHKSLLKDIFLFDYWVQNEDRTFTVEHGGNPNLLVDSSRENIYMMDHNLAFDPDFNIDSFCKVHLGRAFWFDEQYDMVRVQHYQKRMAEAVKDWRAIEDGLPNEWKMGDSTPESDILAIIKQRLMAFDTDKFWEPLQ